MPLIRPIPLLALMMTVRVVLGADVQERMSFGPAERVVFLGDNITFDGLYVEYTEALLRTSHPRTNWRIFNKGQPGLKLHDQINDAASRTDEATNDWFSTEVAAVKPTIIFAMFGMFDGGFAPPDAGRATQFQADILKLARRTKQETKAQLVLLTPPVFDHPAQEGQVSDTGTPYSSRSPFPGYDGVLEEYTAWIVGHAQAWDGVRVIDIHAAMHRHLTLRRMTDRNFTLQPGRIRPNATGHMVIASTIARSLGLTASKEACDIHVRDGIITGAVTGLKTSKTGLSFTWKAPVPLIPDPRWDADSTRLEGWEAGQSHATLRVRGLAPGEYTITADDKVVAYGTASELSAGVPTDTLAGFPTVRRAKNVLEYLDERRRLEQQLKLKGDMKPADREAELKRAEAITARLHGMTQPEPIHVVIERKPD